MAHHPTIQSRGFPTIDFDYCKLFLELVILYFSKIVMLQCLKIVIISPFSNEYILYFSRKLKWL